MNNRPLYVIANEINKDWGKNMSNFAKPYVTAMQSLDKITDNYMFDSAKSIVLYFLANASGWRGEKAKAIKAELRKMCK